MTTDNFDWVVARNECSIEKVFHRLRLDVQTDVETRQSLRERGEFGFDQSFAFTSSGNKFSASMRTRTHGRSVIFAFRKNHIVVLDDIDRELMSATVTLTDDKGCRLVVGEEVLDEWQFRKRALESLFFDEIGEAP